MDTVIDWNDPQLTKAVLLWTGYGKANTPCRNKDSVLQHFGADAARWLSLIEFLADKFYESNASIEAADMQEMWRIAIDDFKKKYHDVPEDVAKAFAWCYTFDNR